MEIFIDVEGFEGLYQIGNKGNIKSVKRDIIMKPYTDKYGYFKITLSKKAKNYPRNIHRLVALAFVPNPNNKPQVNHIDGNKKNNEPSNLEWVTESENIAHAFKTGLASQRYRFKAVEMLDKETEEVLRTFDSVTQAGAYFGKTEQNIIGCCKGRKKTAYGYKWRYANA